MLILYHNHKKTRAMMKHPIVLLFWYFSNSALFLTATLVYYKNAYVFIQERRTVSSQTLEIRAFFLFNRQRFFQSQIYSVILLQGRILFKKNMKTLQESQQSKSSLDCWLEMSVPGALVSCFTFNNFSWQKGNIFWS